MSRKRDERQLPLRFDASEFAGLGTQFAGPPRPSAEVIPLTPRRTGLIERQALDAESEQLLKKALSRVKLF